MSESHTITTEKQAPEKLEVVSDDTSHRHHGHQYAADEDHVTGKVFSIDDVDLPAGYYRSFHFWGSMIAIGLSLACGVAGFSFIAPVLAFINEDIGPSPNLTWVALSYTLSEAVALMLVGRLSDIFGRRWFFIGGTVIALLGSIVCAVSPNIPCLIAGETLIGLGSSAQICFNYAVVELVPMKYRFFANGYAFCWLILSNGFGSVIAYSFIYQTSSGWRGIFYLLIAMNVVCTACWYFCYYPPSFEMKHSRASKMEYIKNFDYMGTFLATLGQLLFLMGLSWGGTLHPWRSGHVIGTIVVGFLLIVAFFVWEAKANLKEPLLPLHIISNKGWLVNMLLWSIGSSVYYAFAIIWPSQVLQLYAVGHSPMWAGWASAVVGAGLTVGEVLGGLAKKKVQWVTRVCFFSGSVLLAAMASCTPDTPVRAILLLLFGTLLIGINECVTSAAATICLKDQREIGTAIGIGGSLRSFVSTLCSTVYTVVLSNRLAQTIPSQVPRALVNAGLPADSTTAFLTAYANGTQAAFDQVPGINPTIQATGTRAYRYATSDAFKTVFLTTIAFSGVGVILTFFAPDIDKLLTGEVALTLHARKDEEKLGGEKETVTKTT